MKALLQILLLILVSCNPPSGSTNETFQEQEEKTSPQTQIQPEDTVEIETDTLAQLSGQELLIEGIRKEFQSINASSELYIDTLKLDTDAPGGAELLTYHNALGELRKMVAIYYGEGGKTVQEYYLKDNLLMFAFSQVHQYGRPPNMDDATFKKDYTDKGITPEDRIRENRYYFDEDVFLIRHINPEGKVLEEEQLDTKSEDQIVKEFEKLEQNIERASQSTEQASAPSQFNEAVHEWMKSIAEDQAFTYTYEEFDLNGDGVAEYLCGLRGRFWCGSGGCSFVILQQSEGGGLKLHSRGGPTYGPHFVSKEKKDGWHTLVLDPKVGKTLDQEEYRNYPVLIYNEGVYEQEWMDDLDPNERLDLLLEGATQVLGESREFHKVEIQE